MSELNQIPPKNNHLMITVAILVGIMIISGIFVTSAYLKTLEQQSKVERPPFNGRLQDQFIAQNQDGEIVNTGQLSGKVWLACAISATSPAPAQRNIEVMQHLAENHPLADQIHFVLVSVDFEQDDLETRDMFAQRLDLPTEKFWILQEEKATKFIPSRLKLSPVRKAKSEDRLLGYGNLWYDPRMVIIDTTQHLRGYLDEQGRAQMFFDFSTDNASNPVAEEPQLEKLSQLINTLLEEPSQETIKQGPRPITYLLALAVGITFVIVFFGKQRLKSKR